METANDLRLDGNAVAGLLSEALAPEATRAVARCGGCGAEGPVGTLLVYPHGMGVVLHCPGCEHLMIRIAHLREEVVLDMGGAVFLRLRVDGWLGASQWDRLRSRPAGCKQPAEASCLHPAC
jgi:hypothetical protein